MSPRAFASLTKRHAITIAQSDVFMVNHIPITEMKDLAVRGLDVSVAAYDIGDSPVEKARGIALVLSFTLANCAFETIVIRVCDIESQAERGMKHYCLSHIQPAPWIFISICSYAD